GVHDGLLRFPGPRPARPRRGRPAPDVDPPPRRVPRRERGQPVSPGAQVTGPRQRSTQITRSGAPPTAPPPTGGAYRTSPLCWCCQVGVGFFFEVVPTGAFLAAGCGRRLAVPPGRSSALRSGRSTWACRFADG